MLQPGTRAHRIACALMQTAHRRIELLAAEGADLFISTHPFASQVLGELRSQGRLRVPAATYLTDASVHPLWVHRGMDLHLGLNPVTADEARALGGKALAIEPLVPNAYLGGQVLSPRARSEVRRRLGLSAHDRMVLVVGGSSGIGDLVASALDVRATGLGVPVVACGTNRRLRGRLFRLPGVLALGWRDDLPELIQAADCVVQNAGGFTAWESLAAGTPVVTSRPISGHGTSNAAALEGAGLVPWARTRDELAAELARAFSLEDAPDLAVGS